MRWFFFILSCNVSQIPFVILYRMDTELSHLIEGCRRQERKAQEALYKRYAPWLYRICLRITANPAEAEEAMQDCVMKILTHINGFQESASFSAWMQQIAVRTAIDYAKQQKEIWEELPDNFPLADDSPAEEDDENIRYSVEQIKTGISKLPASARIILSLYLFEGYDTEEIATILHLQPASVRSQYLRGKRKLVEMLRPKR